MFVVFQRRHYNKTLLVMLSTFLHLQENATDTFETLRQHLVAFDEYPVENFHSVLRRRTKETDTADEIALQAKEIDACKHELHSFQSMFVPPKKFNFSSKRINKLKVKAAEFLTHKFESLYTHPNMAVQQPRTPRQPKHTTKWQLPNLFGELMVTNRVLPLGFMSVEHPPNPNRKCDAPDCTKDHPVWNVFRGCGHSFHVECLLPQISTCPLCRTTLLAKIEDLGKTANNAMFAQNVDAGIAAEHECGESDSEETDDDDDEPVDEQAGNEASVSVLLEKIGLWRWSKIPLS